MVAEDCALQHVKVNADAKCALGFNCFVSNLPGQFINLKNCVGKLIQERILARGTIVDSYGEIPNRILQLVRS